MSDKSSGKLKGLKRRAIPRSLTASLAGLRAGGALAVDGAWQGLMGRDDSSDFARKEARRFVKKLGKLKGTYVKIGQMMAMFGEHFLPPVLTEAMHELGSNTKPFPWSEIAPSLQQSLGVRLQELDIDETAIAAASLAQVHRARIIETGEEICLKVQYPGLAEVIDQDFDHVVGMLKLARWVKSGRDLDSWLESMREYLHNEIDYQREASFCRAMNAHLDNLGDAGAMYHAPKVIDRYSRAQVLALEYVPGKMVNAPEIGKLSKARRNALGRAMLDLFFYELYDWGMLQSDPNFGNYLLRTAKRGSGESDELVLLDFGSMLDCTDDFRFHLQGAIAAGFEEDESALIEALIGLGCLKPNSDKQAKKLFADFCMHLLEPLRPPESLPASSLNKKGEYRWADSQLMQRAGKKAAANLASPHFDIPSREFAVIARKLTGVFTFISVLGAEFNGHEAVAEHIARWREREGI
jgi:predicted unusual protein kinase regulating ubiquinone biosynthesis (AarF/ABC1/UbiB family)